MANHYDKASIERAFDHAQAIGTIRRWTYLTGFQYDVELTSGLTEHLHSLREAAQFASALASAAQAAGLTRERTARYVAGLDGEDHGC